MSNEIYNDLHLCNIVFFYLFNYFKPFGLDDAVKPEEEKEDLNNYLMNHNYFCRAATGFTPVC